MKNCLPILLGLLFCTTISFCQNYSCISSVESKVYFTNSFGYLTGMRIDSIKNINGNTVYYPFKTTRVSGYGITDLVVLDTAGPCWLGASITETADFKTYIPTKWNDTVFIKNDALLGESWNLYDDSTDISFVATVTSIDTQTIANVVDSVKTITIHTMQNGNIVTTDSLDNFEFGISKYHGLVQTLPFYFFPFYDHQQMSIILPNDYYLNQLVQSYSPGNVLDFRHSSSSQKVDYNPFYSNAQLYNYDVGDIIVSVNDPTFAFDDTEVDTIKSKQTQNNVTTYDVSYFLRHLVDPSPGNPYIQDTNGNKVLNYSTIVPLDTGYILMPEEMGNSFLQYYIPNDSTLCYVSPLYASVGTPIRGENIDYEFDYDNTTVKMGIGVIERNLFDFPTYTQIHKYITGAKKNGQYCGSAPLAVSNVKNEMKLDIYPNPAKDFVVISLTSPQQKIENVKIDLIDLLGRPVCHWIMRNGSLNINTQNIQPGTYLLRVSTEENSAVRKLTIEK